MVGDDDASESPPPSDEPCMACRGSGQVISTLGGERKSVACPWCEGSGKRIAGHDAQARWRDEPDPAA